LTVRFPDAQSFVKSLNGERNLMRSTRRFPTRQRDECTWGKDVFQMPLAWEVPVNAKTPEDRSASMLRAGVTIEKALTVQSSVHPATLFQIARTGDTVGVKRMIDANCSIEEAKEPHGLNALHLCAMGNFADTAKVILEAHCNQQYLDSEIAGSQATPLHFAAQYGACDVAELLLQKRATVNKANVQGATPLYVASQNGFRDLAEILLRNGAAVNQPMKDGGTPLYIASEKGFHDLAEMLLRNGAAVNQARQDGNTALQFASHQGHQEIVKLLQG